MSWMQKLYEAYETAAAAELVGKETEGQPMLLPMFHSTQLAQIEMVIDGEGNFLRADVIEDKQSQRTVIPCTERSAARANGVIPMPLFDKLLYIAGDYAQYCPPTDKEKKYDSYFDAYLEGLRAWLPTAPPEVRAWHAYVEKRHVVGDLVACGVLCTDTDGKVPAKWSGDGEKPAIYRVVVGAPLDAFVRFRVHQPEGGEDRVWMLPGVRQSFIDFQNGLEGKSDICYVLGRRMPVSVSSPKFIRYPGDGAKLISSNDTAGFTYRGRFQDAAEALAIGQETTGKAHAALKWLIQRQGYHNGEQVILTFATGGKPMPSLGADTVGIDGWEELDAAHEEFSTNEAMARRINQALAGYRCKLTPTDEAVVMGLDSATPGRLSIFYYREMRAEDLFGRICRGHSSCAWRHTYRSAPDGTDDNGKPKYRRVTFTGAPAPVDIVKAAFGDGASDKLLKSGVERLLPCIADGAPLPIDIMKAAARRAAQRVSMTRYEQDKALTIACSLIRKFNNDRNQKEEWGMALQPEVNDRSYLFGRALAYAENIENYALQLSGEDRTTNAERLMVAFAKHPAKTWMLIRVRLQPYQQKLGNRVNRLNEEMEGVISRLEVSGYTNEPLNERYLLGYDCQKQEFARRRNENAEKKNAENKDNDNKDA